MPQSFASLHCHIVFSTKNRHPLITPEIQPRLFQYMGGILRNNSSALIAVGGMPTGSPGMEVPGRAPQQYNVVTFDKQGAVRVYSVQNR